MILSLRKKGSDVAAYISHLEQQTPDHLLVRTVNRFICFCTQIFAITGSTIPHWKVGEDEPWCLATNLPDRHMTLQAYVQRMWIEETFGDLKSHGFDLECTMLHHADKLSRLTLAVVL